MNYYDCIKKIAIEEHENIQALNGLWLNIQHWYLFLTEFGNICDFNYKRKVFFDVIEYSMEKGWLKLAKNGQFLQGSIIEQILLFKKVFPNSELDTIEKDKDFFHLWFFSDECPAGAVWVFILDNGTIHYEWT